MALTATRARIPGTGEVFVAPVGTAGPTNTATALGAAFKGLGYTTDGGVTLGKTINREEVRAWQALTPLKYIYTGLDLTLSAAFQQAQDEVAGLWWGADFAANATSEFKADLPVIPAGVEKALVLSFETDGPFIHRIYVPRVEITDTGDVNVTRAALAFQISFAALAPASGSTLATWFTNDPAFDPATV